MRDVPTVMLAVGIVNVIDKKLYRWSLAIYVIVLPSIVCKISSSNPSIAYTLRKKIRR